MKVKMMRMRKRKRKRRTEEQKRTNTAEGQSAGRSPQFNRGMHFFSLLPSPFPRLNDVAPADGVDRPPANSSSARQGNSTRQSVPSLLLIFITVPGREQQQHETKHNDTRQVITPSALTTFLSSISSSYSIVPLSPSPPAASASNSTNSIPIRALQPSRRRYLSPHLLAQEPYASPRLLLGQVCPSLRHECWPEWLETNSISPCSACVGLLLWRDRRGPV